MFVKENDVLSHLFKPTLIMALCSLTDLISWEGEDWDVQDTLFNLLGIHNWWNLPVFLGALQNLCTSVCSF